MLPLRMAALILIAATMCLLFAPVQTLGASRTSADTPSVFHGVYAGVMSIVATFDTELSSSSESIEGVSASGISNAVFLGTGTVHNNLFLAIEGGFVSHNADFSGDILGNDAEGDLEEGYGASVRLGGLPAQNILTYCSAGWQQLTIDLSDDTGWSKDKSFDGVRLGLGLEYQTSQNVFIRGEYNYTLYYKETLSGGAEEYDIKPNASLFQFGIGYRF